MKGAPPCLPSGVLLGFGVRCDSTGHNGSADFGRPWPESSTKRRGSTEETLYFRIFRRTERFFVRCLFQGLEMNFLKAKEWQIRCYWGSSWSEEKIWIESVDESKECSMKNNLSIFKNGRSGRIVLNDDCVIRYIGTWYRVVQYLYVAKLICRLREMLMCIVINH